MRYKIGAGRGRPRGLYHSRFDIRILEYLVELSLKHGIEKTELFNAIVAAWKNGRTTCEELEIETRVKYKDRAIFLITKDDAVVAQFSIPEYILKENSPLNGFKYMSERPEDLFPILQRRSRL